MTPENPSSLDALQLYMPELGKAVPLSRETEGVVGRRLEQSAAELRRLVTSSPFALRQVRHWSELIEAGEMSAKELLPRGSVSAPKVARLRRRVRALARLIARAPKSRLPELGRRVETLPLDPEKIRRLGNRVRDQARRLREGRPTDPLPMPAAEVLALDRALERLQERVAADKLALFQGNLRLVFSIARQYASDPTELADLLQEGGLGLMRAVEKYKASKGFRFSTYATWWIRQAIHRALEEQKRTVHVPAHIQEGMARFHKVGREYAQRHGRPPRPAEAARLMGVPVRKVQDILSAMQETFSLDVPVGEDQASLEDTLEDKTVPEPLERAEESMRRAAIGRWLSTLAPREAGILRLRFGIGGGDPRTLDQAGRAFRVTRERARQIQVAALKKLRASPRYEAMRDYLG